MSIELAVGLLGAIMAVCSIISFFASRSSNTRSQGVERGKELAKLEYITGQLEGIASSMNNMKTDVSNINTKVIIMADSLDAAWQHIDAIEEQIGISKIGRINKNSK